MPEPQQKPWVLTSAELPGRQRAPCVATLRVWAHHAWQTRLGKVQSKIHEGKKVQE